MKNIEKHDFLKNTYTTPPPLPPTSPSPTSTTKKDNFLLSIFSYCTRFKILKLIYYRSLILRRITSHLFSTVIANVCVIEISSYCNAKCIFCSYPKIAEDKSRLVIMDDETFNKSLEYVRRYKFSSIAFTPRVGETLINKNWHRYLQQLLNEDYVFRVEITTNGILLTEKQVEQLLNSKNLHKLYLHFSIGGYDSKTYKFMYGVDKFQVIRDNINHLLKQFKEKSLKNLIYIHLRIPESKHFDKKEACRIFNPTGYEKCVIRCYDEYTPLNLSQFKEKRYSDTAVDFLPPFILRL